MIFWFQGIPEGIYGARADNDREAGEWKNYYIDNTYKGLRLVAEEYNLYYSVWCTNETEFYDLKVSSNTFFTCFFLSSAG